MNATSIRRMLAVSALVGLVAAFPAAAVTRSGFVRLDGITGDAADSQHQGWFQSARIDLGGLGSGMSIPVGGGTFSFDVARDGTGFAALVRACLGHQRIPTAELSIGSDRYGLSGVTVEMITVGSMGSGMAAAGPIVVSVRYQSIRDLRASVPPAGRMGAGVVAPKK